MYLAKRIILLSLICSASICMATKKDSIPSKIISPQRPNYVFKSSPFPILWGVIPFTAEFRWICEFTTTPKQSSQIGISYLGKSPVFSVVEAYARAQNPGFGKYIIKGIRLQGWYKFYYNGKKYSPNGAYLAPHISWAYARIAPEKYMKANRYLLARYLNIDLHCGYQFFVNKKYAVDMFVAYGYKNYAWYDHLTTSQFKKTGVLQTANNPPQNNPDDLFKNINRPTRFQIGINVGIGRK